MEPWLGTDVPAEKVMCQCLFLPPPSPAWPQAAGNWTVSPGPLTSQVQETIRTRDAAKQRTQTNNVADGWTGDAGLSESWAAVILPTAPPVRIHNQSDVDGFLCRLDIC